MLVYQRVASPKLYNRPPLKNWWPRGDNPASSWIKVADFQALFAVSFEGRLTPKMMGFLVLMTPTLVKQKT